MNSFHVNATERPSSGQRCAAKWLCSVILLVLGLQSGCSQLRLPAIDPTGSCLFAPLPTTTTLALPGSAGEGCLHLGCLKRFGDHLHDHFAGGQTIDGPAFAFPEPAFPEPEPPPPCPPPAAAGPIGGGIAGETCGVKQPTQPCVPSAPCNGACASGPPAVLLGNECDFKKLLHLPERGKRGCILLSPQKVVAPVGGEVVLLSGICGTDGYLQTAEPLEWMLTPESVGTFIQVGDDDPGLLHRLAGIETPRKHDPSYARGVTSTKRTLITRGNLNPRDDVQLEKGQTWLTISSPTEGTSRITVLAPESECWDQRKATATIYWIDARSQFPAPQIADAGSPVALTTRVTKAEGSVPARGWRVRYEILNPELARFAGSQSGTVVEATVDDSGNATAELLPLPGTSGTAAVGIQVIRPAGESGNMPALTLSRGQAFVTWVAPQLRLRLGGPQIASYEVPFTVTANVANPGNAAAENVRVEIEIPANARVLSTELPAQRLPDRVIWDLDVPIPQQQELDLRMEMVARDTFQLRAQARADGELFAEDALRVDVYQPSLEVEVTPEQDRYEAGETIRFQIDVRNTGDRPLSNVALNVAGDQAMFHAQSGNRRVLKDLQADSLQPGDVWPTSVEFVAQEAGRRCITVEATAAGGQQAAAEACVIAINPPPPTPALTTTLEAPPSVFTGDRILARGRVINSGKVPLQDVEVSMVFEPELDPQQATQPFDASRLGQYMIVWRIPELAPGSTAVVLEADFVARQATPRSRVLFTARSDLGATDTSELFVEILSAAPASPAPQPSEPSLPPATPPPAVPDTRAQPPQNPPPQPGVGGPRAPALPQRSGQLAIALLPLDNPARVGEPIRFRLTVLNDREVADGDVRLSFRLPDGLTVENISSVTNPAADQFTSFGRRIILEPIRSMRAGETVTYQVVLRSNQPQTFDLAVEAESRLSTGGVSESATVQVVP